MKQGKDDYMIVIGEPTPPDVGLTCYPNCIGCSMDYCGGGGGGCAKHLGHTIHGDPSPTPDPEGFF